MPLYLVTGGAGFIGSHLAEALVQRGAHVRVLDNLSTGNIDNLESIRRRIDFVQGDVTDAATVGRLVEGVDCIFHQAALPSVPRSVQAPLETHAACVTGTVTLLDAARRAGVRRLVYAASSSAYGDQPYSSKRETDRPAPLSPYGAAKLAAEFYCQAFTATYGFPTISLRYFNVFGPRQDPNSPYSAVIPRFVTALLSGRQPIIYGDGRQQRDFTYIANVVQANLRAAEADQVRCGVFNVATGRTTDLLTLIGMLNRVLRCNVAPLHEPPRAGDVRDSMADITRARQLLGYEPQVDLEEGLRRTVQHYQHGSVQQNC